MLSSIDLKSSPRRRRAVTIQMAGGFINRGIVVVQGVLLVPLYLHFIGGRMYGLWLASGGVLAWLGFMDMGLGAVLTQRVSSAYGRKEYERAGSYFFNGMLIYCLLSLIFFLAALGLSYPLPGWFNARPEESGPLQYCFLLAALATVAHILSDGLRGFAQALQRPLFPSLILALCRVLGLGGVIGLLYLGYGLWSIAFGLLLFALPALLLNLLYCGYLFRALGGRFSLDQGILREYYSLSPSLFAGKLGHSIVARIEPTLIAAMIRPELATAFVVTKRVAEMVGMLLQVVFSSFLPSFSHLYAQDQIKAARVLSKTMSMSLMAGVIGYGAYVAGNQPFINLWVGADIFAGQGVTIMIALGLMPMSTQSFLYQLLVGTGDIAGPSYLMLAESLLRVLLMALFLYWLGLVGLPLAMLMSCGVFSMVFYKRLAAKVTIDFFRSRAYPKLLVIFVTTFSIYAWLGSKISSIESWIWFVLYMAVIMVGLCVFLLMSNPDSHAFIMKKKEALFNDKIIT